MSWWGAIPLILMLQLLELGTVNIRTEPGAQVFWEGINLGETDSTGRIEIRDIPPGTFTLTLRRPGFATLTQRVEVEGSLALNLPMEPLLPPPVNPILSDRPPVTQPSRSERREPGPAFEDRSPAETPAPHSGALPEAGATPPLDAAGGPDEGEAPALDGVGTSASRSSVPPALFLLAAVIILGGLWYWRRRYDQPGELPEPPPPTHPLGSSLSPVPAGPLAPHRRELNFLDSMKQRERQLDQGIEMIKPATSGKEIIDIDVEDIREVREE